jgi:hypothetical protein
MGVMASKEAIDAATTSLLGEVADRGGDAEKAAAFLAWLRRVVPPEDTFIVADDEED